MSTHLTQERIAAALAAAAQPEGETPWAELTTEAPMTHLDVCALIFRAEHPESVSDVDGPTLQAEGSRARIIRDLARRDSYLAAMSAAEQLAATIPVLPATISIHNAVWHSEVYLSLRYHGDGDDGDAVRTVASYLEIPVTEKPGVGSVHVVAEGTAENGVRFEAYTLVDAPRAVEE
ncbi:hypothetical protein ABZ069_34765 [Streptomyces microflavus]|uniref:hypothetical protein n=1 Tax=Streptomyces microflavus TaxID=1919 RepID=UPI0033AE691C